MVHHAFPFHDMGARIKIAFGQAALLCRRYVRSRRMKSASLAALFLCVVLAKEGRTQQPAAPAAAPRRIEGMSDAGNAVFARAQAAPDPELAGLVRQQRLVRDQLNSASFAATVDVVRIEELLRKSEELQGRIRTRNNDRMLTVLRALPEGDRAPFLRGVLKSAAR
jgi:hypothetical protein